MKTSHRLLAFGYGFVLMYFVAIWLTGFLAARAVPVEYFRYFSSMGEGGKIAAHALLSLGLHALPTALCLLAGTAAAAYLPSTHRRTVGLFVIAGAVVSYVFWVSFYSFTPPLSEFSPFSVIQPYIQAPWWLWPQLASPAVALLLAYRLLPGLAAAPAGA
jgi:hypothetical protein